MDKITEYKIVVGVEGGSKFSDEVNQLISEGWLNITTDTFATTGVWTDGVSIN